MSAPAAGGPAGSAPASEVEVEVVDTGAGGSKATRRLGLIGPIDGKVEAWIDHGDDARRCQLDVHPARAGLHLELRCGGGGKEHELKVEVTREFTAGQRTRVAEVSRPGGAKSQVFVTLQ